MRLRNLPGIAAVILTGSAARDELTARVTKSGQLEILGDLEFLVITKTDHATTRSGVLSIFQEITDRRQPDSPLFSLDAAFRTTRSARHLPKTLWLYETTREGKVVSGDDSFLERLPRVTLENLNYGELNEILLWRLFMLATKLPSSFWAGVMTSEEAERCRYVIARNYLDTATWVLPHAGVLTSGYHQRFGQLQLLAAHPYVRQLGGTDFLDRHRRALALKSGEQDAEDVFDWYRATITVFDRCLSLLSGFDGRKRTLTDLQIRRMVGQALRAAKSRRSSSIVALKDVRWRHRSLRQLQDWHLAAVRELCESGEASQGLVAQRRVVTETIIRRTPWLND